MAVQVKLPPQPAALIESTRAIGYSLGAAIADIIDNSISAKASEVSIYFPPSEDNWYLAILDNGQGMDASALQQAMRYGSTNPLIQRNKQDLGRYGLGMKTASLSQCRRLTVVSKKDGRVSACQWDLDTVIESDNWILNVLEASEIAELPRIEKLNGQQHGTLVIWQQCDRLKSVRTGHNTPLDEAESHLRLVFHRYLDGEKEGCPVLRIRWNENPLKAINPYKNKWHDLEKKTILFGSGRVVLTPYQLKLERHLSQAELDEMGNDVGIRQTQGFYVYRNRRLIIWGTWFGLARLLDSSKFLRIQVDIPNTMDADWALDIKKSKARPPQYVLNEFRAYVETLLEQTAKTRRGKCARTSMKAIPLWESALASKDNSVRYSVNRKHPLVEELLAKEPSLEILIKLLEQQLPIADIRFSTESDRKIENETELTFEEAFVLLQESLAKFPAERHPEVLKLLLTINPFVRYATEIQERLSK